MALAISGITPSKTTRWTPIATITGPTSDFPTPGLPLQNMYVAWVDTPSSTPPANDDDGTAIVGAMAGGWSQASERMAGAGLTPATVTLRGLPHSLISVSSGHHVWVCCWDGGAPSPTPILALRDVTPA